MASYYKTLDLPSRLLRVLLVSSGVLLSGLLGSSQAQMTLDGSLGPRGVLTGPNYRIDAAVGQIRGGNLFHSFGQFNLSRGESATFTGPNTISNILSRVTGGQQSVIDGRLQSTIPGANLYLLNPSGVLFGPNASLDISGSFHVSTADVLRFADGATFSAHIGERSTLTTAPPAAFGFLGPTPAAITVRGSSLGVSEGKAVSVVGGEIQVVGGQLVAPSGRVQIASVASSGEVLASPAEMEPNLQVDSFTRLGRLEISQGGLLDVSGNRGGTVLIRSGRLLVDRAQIFANTLGDMNGASLGLDLRITADAVIHDSDLRVSPSAAGNGGNVTVNVGSLMLTDGGRILSSSRGAGHGGTLTVAAADAIFITGRNSQGNQSGLFSNAFSLGDAGQLFISAPALTMDDGQVQAGTVSGSRGNAGGAEVRVGRLTLTGGAQINTDTRGSGRGGDLSVMAAEAIAITGRGSELPQTGLFSVADGSGDAGRLFVSAPRLDSAGGRILGRTLGDGNGGDIEVRVGQLRLTAGAQIFNGTGLATSGGVIGSDGPGRGGNLTVVATDSLFIAGQDQAGFASGLFSGAQIGRGNAGNVFIATPLLTLDAGGQIEAAVSRLSRGNGGSIEVQVGQLLMSNGAQISTSTFGSGQGGQVMVTASDTLTLVGTTPTGRLSGIFANAQGTAIGAGAAGSIVVTAPRIMVSDGAQIISSTFGPGTGGSVMVTASDTLTLTGTGMGPQGAFPSSILATTEGQAVGAGAAGTVVVEARDVRLTDGAAIASTTIGPGQGGTVQVTATDTLTLTGADPGGAFPSGIFANAGGKAVGAGAAGTVVVEARHVTLTDGARIASLTFGPGQGGTVQVTATDTLTLRGIRTTPEQVRPSGIFASTEGAGAAGSIVVQAPRIMVSDGARISSGTFGPGAGGTVRVTADDTLTLTGTTPTGAFASGIFATAEGTAEGAGAAGSIVVQAPRIMVSDGVQISSSTSGPGAGGSVMMTATDTIDIAGQGSELAARTTAQGRGGDVLLQARQVQLTDGATISAESTGLGNAGNITIATGDTFLSTNGRVVTLATQADGGNIQITAPHFLRLRASRITAEVGGGPQTVGGNIALDSQFVLLQHSQIIANAFAGRGGNIGIQAQQVFLADPASQVSASSTLGINGVVNIQAPVTSISGAVAPLPQEFALLTELLRDRCAGRLREGRVSRFVLGGRDGVPLEPGSLLQSPLQRVEQEAGVQEGKRQPQNPGPQHAWVSSAQAHAREGWEGECARWMGQPGTPGSPTRHR